MENLRLVADAFPRERIRAFIVFAKTSSFSAEEIKRCQLAQGEFGKRILLSPRELEPYFMYERIDRAGVQISSYSLEDMARTTQQLYFQ